MPMPGPGADAVGDDGCESAVKVKEEEDGESSAEKEEDEELAVRKRMWSVNFQMASHGRIC